MLVIKIELWPRGLETKAREIGRMTIANVGGTPEHGDYAVQAQGDGLTIYGASLKGVPRGHDKLWLLLRQALQALEKVTG